MALSLALPQSLSAESRHGGDDCTAGLIRRLTIQNLSTSNEPLEVTVGFKHQNHLALVRGKLKLIGTHGRWEMGLLTDARGRTHLFDPDLTDRYSIYEAFTPRQPYRGRPLVALNAKKIHEAYCRLRGTETEREAYNEMAKAFNKSLGWKKWPLNWITPVAAAAGSAFAYSQYGPLYEWFDTQRLDPGLLGFFSQHQSNFLLGIMAMAFTTGLFTTASNIATHGEGDRVMPLGLALLGNALLQVYFEVFETQDFGDLGMGAAGIALFGLGSIALTKFYGQNLAPACPLHPRTK